MGPELVGVMDGLASVLPILPISSFLRCRLGIGCVQERALLRLLRAGAAPSSSPLLPPLLLLLLLLAPSVRTVFE